MYTYCSRHPHVRIMVVGDNDNDDDDHEEIEHELKNVNRERKANHEMDHVQHQDHVQHHPCEIEIPLLSTSTSCHITSRCCHFRCCCSCCCHRRRRQGRRLDRPSQQKQVPKTSTTSTSSSSSSSLCLVCESERRACRVHPLAESYSHVVNEIKRIHQTPQFHAFLENWRNYLQPELQEHEQQEQQQQQQQQGNNDNIAVVDSVPEGYYNEHVDSVPEGNYNERHDDEDLLYREHHHHHHQQQQQQQQANEFAPKDEFISCCSTRHRHHPCLMRPDYFAAAATMSSSSTDTTATATSSYLSTTSTSSSTDAKASATAITPSRSTSCSSSTNTSTTTIDQHASFPFLVQHLEQVQDWIDQHEKEYENEELMRWEIRSLKHVLMKQQAEILQLRSNIQCYKEQEPPMALTAADYDDEMDDKSAGTSNWTHHQHYPAANDGISDIMELHNNMTVEIHHGSMSSLVEEQQLNQCIPSASSSAAITTVVCNVTGNQISSSNNTSAPVTVASSASAHLDKTSPVTIYNKTTTRRAATPSTIAASVMNRRSSAPNTGNSAICVAVDAALASVAANGASSSETCQHHPSVDLAVALRQHQSTFFQVGQFATFKALRSSSSSQGHRHLHHHPSQCASSSTNTSEGSVSINLTTQFKNAQRAISPTHQANTAIDFYPYAVPETTRSITQEEVAPSHENILSRNGCHKKSNDGASSTWQEERQIHTGFAPSDPDHVVAVAVAEQKEIQFIPSQRDFRAQKEIQFIPSPQESRVMAEQKEIHFIPSPIVNRERRLVG